MARMSLLIDGKKVAASLREEVELEISRLRKEGLAPKLAVILAGEDPASVLYSRSMEKACLSVGVAFELFHLPETPSEEKVINVIQKLNNDSLIHGIMIMLPLPQGINKQKVLEAVSPLKDVDGVHPINRGYILSNSEGLFPTTPQSCIEILLRNGIEITGKHAVLVGRGESVGKPLVYMMLNQNATVTVCHTRTRDLARHTDRLTYSLPPWAGPHDYRRMVKPGAVVVDAGINEAEGGGICGDGTLNASGKLPSYFTRTRQVGSLTTMLIQKICSRLLECKENILEDKEAPAALGDFSTKACVK